MNKNILFGALLSLVLITLPACWLWNKKTETQSEQKNSLYVINVLDKELYDDCHIAGSTQVAFDAIENFAKDLDKNAEIVVYCSNYSCTASGYVAQQLTSLGFEKVWAYEAGMAEWHQMNVKNPGKYPVEGACQKSYLIGANEKPAIETENVFAIITTDDLREKMIAHGLIREQVESQQAAA